MLYDDTTCQNVPLNASDVSVVPEVEADVGYAVTELSLMV